MVELQAFSHDEFGQIRMLMLDGVPWAVGKDIASALGYKNPQDAISAHVDVEDKRLIQKSEIAATDIDVSNRGLMIVNESGLYSLILSSKFPATKRLKLWITNAVLPAVRETGAYGSQGDAGGAPELPRATRDLTTDDYAEAARIVSKCGVSKLEIVLHFLWLAGFDLPGATQTGEHPCRQAQNRGSPERDTAGEAASLINRAIEQYGMTLRGIGRLVGLQPTQVNRIRRGESTPTLERSRTICDALQRELNQIYA